MPEHRDYEFTVRVTAHECNSRDQAATVIRSFLTEVERVIQRHALTVEFEYGNEAA